MKTPGRNPTPAFQLQGLCQLRPGFDVWLDFILR